MINYWEWKDAIDTELKSIHQQIRHINGEIKDSKVSPLPYVKHEPKIKPKLFTDAQRARQEIELEKKNGW